MSNPSVCFNRFDSIIDPASLPELFTNPFSYIPHPLCLLAAEKLQQHLRTQTEWIHNFGLTETDGSTIAGKMFGVLIVQNQENEIGYLAAFSGKLAGGNHHAYFVPPVFDLLTDGGFLTIGMQELTRMNLLLDVLETDTINKHSEQITQLKIDRKAHSTALQQQIFSQYHFLNQAGEEKSLTVIFNDARRTHAPSGAGECAAPKLLQYAFQQGMKPIGMAEFWWGQSPKSTHWKHGYFYPSCQEKCAPILAHMLKGISIDGSQQEVTSK